VWKHHCYQELTTVNEKIDHNCEGRGEAMMFEKRLKK
jgi:hypothetical protein